jgi:hypothetical protein
MTEGKHPEENNGKELLSVDFLNFLSTLLIDSDVLGRHQKPRHTHYAHRGKGQ